MKYWIYLKTNWLGVSGLLIGVIGIFLSYYFYALSIKSREPIFITLTNSPLFSTPTGLSSEYIKIVKRSDGQELSKNLYLQEISFWNNGQESIKRENILKPLIIKFSGELEIVDAFISEMNRPEIVQGAISFEPGGNSLAMDFSIVEKYDGFKVQIIYASKNENIATLNGVIEGVDTIKDIKALSRGKILWGIAWILMWGILFIAVVVLFLFMGEMASRACKKLFGKHSEKISSVMSASFLACIAAIGIISVLFSMYKQAAIFAKDSAIESIPKMEKMPLSDGENPKK